MPDSIERELLFDLWNLLKGEEHNGITIANILKVLFAVQGIDPTIVNNEHRPQFNDVDHESIGVFDENGTFHFTVGDIN